MTQLQRYLAMYVELAQRGPAQKWNAWSRATENAERFPEILGELPEMLRVEVLQRQANAVLQGAQTDSSNTSHS
jgi:hypothetical protein